MEDNKSFAFLFPMMYNLLESELKLPEHYFDEYVSENVINTFIRYKDKDCVLILMEQNVNSADFLNMCESSRLFKDGFIDKQGIGIILNIPMQLEDYYSKFKQGFYSKFNEGDKLALLEFFLKYEPEAYDSIAAVIYKHDSLINFRKKELNLDYFDENWELVSIMDENKETYEQ